MGIGRAHGSYEALAADAEVDIIYVATPHPMHHADARLALEHGKHVLVEKAFTLNRAEAQDLADLIRQLSEQMHTAAEQLQFELAARLRDEIRDLKKELRQMTEANK